MADETPATPSGTSSTPTDASASGTTAPVSPAAAAPSTPATPATPASTTEAPAAAATTETPATPAKTEVKPEPALYTIPEDVKLQEPALKAMDTFLKSKLVDGKLVMTPQEAMDQFVDQAKSGAARWQEQLQAIDVKNQAICKERFTPAQLASSEVGVGFLASFDPAVREFAKSQLNNPVFINMMRNIGERLSEDTLDASSPSAHPTPKPKTLEQRMGYAKPN